MQRSCLFVAVSKYLLLIRTFKHPNMLRNMTNGDNRIEEYVNVYELNQTYEGS